MSVAGIGSLVVLTTSGREVRRAGHGTVEVHPARLRVRLLGGREHAASVAWSTTPNPWDDEILRRST